MADVTVGVPDPPAMAIVMRRLARVGGIDWLRSEQAPDSAEDTADRAPDHRANRPGSLGAYCGTMGRPFGNTLSLGRHRGGQ